jgi:pyruvate dehydrogenase E2 component (dihydrolipoamide acetyltransferase)
MAEIVRMPKLSDTMTEGVVAAWHKKIGDKVKAGDVLAEIETDKATMEFESFQEGVLLYIGVENGQTAPVDTILAILGKEGEDVQTLLKEANAPVSKAVAKPVEETPKSVVASASVEVPAMQAGERVKISPLAKKMAEEKNVPLHAVKGSGDQGRIVRRDVESFQVPVHSSASALIGQVAFSEENVSQMRKTIAKRLVDSKTQAPHYYLFMEIDMDNAVQARTALNAMADVKISFNDLVIKAAAVALKKHPKVNSQWLGDKIRYNQHVNIGVAVAVEDGLLVPVVRFADSKGLSQISLEVKDFASRAKNKKLQPADWEGSTFTISNLGMFGIDAFTSIINQPDSAILSVGAIVQKPVVKNGQIVVGNRMNVTLAADHRTVDGATGAAFLQTFKQMLENPVSMLV